MLRCVFLAGVLLMLGGCATIPIFSERSACKADGPTLRVSGATDERMLACLESAGDFRRLEITSGGGEVRTAMKIGRSLAARQAELVVVGYCGSSCANYLIPAANRVRVSAGARILLHGSIDEWLVAEGASPEVYELQREYAAERDIPPGWLLMRTADDGAADRLGMFVTGSARPIGRTAAYIIVEPSFMASCFPALPIQWDSPTYFDRVAASASRKRRLERQGLTFSGTMLCNQGQEYPILP